MVRVAEESTALAEDILSSAQERHEAIVALRSWAAGFLAASQTERRWAFCEAHERRGRGVSCLADATRAFLSQCDREQCAVTERRGHAAEERRGRAAEREAARLDQFLRMRGRHDRARERIAGGVAALATDTRRFLRDCGARRRALGAEVQHAARELRQQLVSGECVRRGTFGRMHRRVAGRVTELAQAVQGQLAESRQAFRAARAAWNGLASARRGAN